MVGEIGMTRTYKLASIAQVLDELSKDYSDDHEISLDVLKIEHTKSKTQFNIGQYYIDDKGSVRQFVGTLIFDPKNMRPLALLETGEDCMEHLLDAVATIAEYMTENTINAFIFKTIHKALAKHKELRK